VNGKSDGSQKEEDTNASDQVIGDLKPPYSHFWTLCQVLQSVLAITA
jgi:hypothetical protein